MKIKLFPIIAAAFILCSSCVKISNTVGGDFLPGVQGYDIYHSELPLQGISNRMADSLSGFSQTKMTIGSIRDSKGRLIRRASAATIMPLRNDIDFGTNPTVKGMYLIMCIDSVSVSDKRFTNIIQRLNVYELEKAYDSTKEFDCNGKTVKHKKERVTKGEPLIAGVGTVSFELSDEFAKRFLTLTKEELKDTKEYLKKFPGLYFDTPDPLGEGGRINIFGTQLYFDSESQTITDNFGILHLSSKYEGVEKDTSFLFYLGAKELVNADSLIQNTAVGAYYPQYALNLTDEECRRPDAGKGEETIPISGGGGLKPIISAAWLKDAVSGMILENGGNPETAIINKASIILPFEYPSDYTQMFKFSEALSPTTRIKNDTSALFVSLTNSSDETENAGEINLSKLCFEPDFTYHMQKLLTTKDEDLKSGNYDIWLLTMTTEVSSVDNSDSDLAQMYEELAYQSYYNGMYSGATGGYADSYTNYYNYMMMAEYAANNVSTSSSLALNLANYFDFELNGPAFPDVKRRPKISVTYSIPKSKTK